MILSNVNVDSLRTLMIAQNIGGSGRASERLGGTPSAISLQMKRLQDEIGVQLLESKAGKSSSPSRERLRFSVRGEWSSWTTR